MKKKHAARHAIEHLSQLQYGTLGLLWLGLVIAFAAAYLWLHTWSPSNAPSPIEGETLVQYFANSMYFSIITATTTGYGDIVPHGLSKLLASAQAILSFFVFGVFISKLVSNRQEIALEQVHKLTFEDVFHNIREGLYIIRKDFDHLMTVAEEKGVFDDQQWENLQTALKQAQSLIQEIPTFYDDEHNLYTIDATREELLQEAVHRTLHRASQLLDVLSEAEIPWEENELSIEGFRTLAVVVDKIVPTWRTRSPYQKYEAFENIMKRNVEIRTRMENAM